MSSCRMIYEKSSGHKNWISRKRRKIKAVDDEEKEKAIEGNSAHSTL